MDVMKNIEDLAVAAAKSVDTDKPTGVSPRSISSYASKAIYYFPILCSKTVLDKSAFMLTANLEASYASFVQACFAMVPAVKVKGSSVNVEDYLKKFHQNIGISSGNDYYLNLKEAAAPYDLFVNEPLNEAITADKIKNALKADTNVTGKDVTEKEITEKIDKDGNKTKTTTVKSRFISQRNFNVAEADKKNNMKPSIVKVECTFIISNNEVKVNIPVGVKTMLHPLDSNELCNHIMDSVAGKGLLHNIIRYTTGEVLSLADILFGISKMKNTIKAKNSETAKWVDALEHRKRLCRMSRAFLSKKPYLPNLAIVISMDDVNDIEQLIGYNLLKDTHRATKFMRDNFLLTFVIADDMTETAYIMYDGHTTYEEYPYSALKRENERTADAMSAISKSLGIR